VTGQSTVINVVIKLMQLTPWPLPGLLIFRLAQDDTVSWRISVGGLSALCRLSTIVEAEGKAHFWSPRRHLATFELNQKAIIVIITRRWMHVVGWE